MSGERIDHAAEARRNADAADGMYGQIENRNGDMSVAQQIEVQTLALVAQVHATLALAEQQRIANLIAIAEFRVAPTDAPALRYLALEPVGDYDAQPTAEIREALGL